MTNKYRKLWRGAQGFGLAVVAIAVACSDLPDGGTDNGDAGAGGESGSAGKSSAGTSSSGSAGKVGAGSANGGSAGEGTELAGAGGQSVVVGGQGGSGEAGQASAGEAGMSGAGGDGSVSARVCVPEAEYCDPEPCVQFSAGCVDHKCLPALALGVTCTSNRQCESGRCDTDTKKCIDTPYCGCQIAGNDCAEGEACTVTHTVDVCYPQARCQVPGAPGVECPSTSECQPGYNCYAFPNGTGITRCFSSKLEGDNCSTFDPAYQCGPGLDCITGDFPPNGVCTAHGDACPCRLGYKCGDDNKCHALAKLGESCASTACDRGLRCPQ